MMMVDILDSIPEDPNPLLYVNPSLHSPGIFENIILSRHIPSTLRFTSMKPQFGVQYEYSVVCCDARAVKNTVQPVI